MGWQKSRAKDPAPPDASMVTNLFGGVPSLLLPLSDDPFPFVLEEEGGGDKGAVSLLLLTIFFSPVRSVLDDVSVPRWMLHCTNESSHQFNCVKLPHVLP